MQIAKSNIIWNLNSGRHQLCCRPFQCGWLRQHWWPAPLTQMSAFETPFGKPDNPKWVAVRTRYHFVFRELALLGSCQLFPVRVVFDFVCSEWRTDGRLSHHNYDLKCSSRGNNFFAPERNVKTNVQKVHGTAGRGQCKLLYNPSTIK